MNLSLLKKIFFLIVFSFTSLTSVSAQYVPDNLDDIRPISNKLMVKVKANQNSKLYRTSKSNSQYALNISKKYKNLSSGSPRLAKQMAANHIRLQDWFEIEISSSSSLEEAINFYQQQDFVEYAEPIYPNYILAPPFLTNDPQATSQQWHLAKSQLYEAWGLHQGDTNTVIGVVDTGVNYLHEDLDSIYYVNYAEKHGVSGIDDDGNGYIDDVSGFNMAYNHPNVVDMNSHGTFVTGMLAANTNNSVGIAGASFDCRVMPLNVFQHHTGRILRMYDAIIYAAENGCKVINVSIGRPNLSFRWEQEVIEYVTLVHDALVVAAAGNTGQELDFYPASYKHVLSVGHSDRNDERPHYGTYSRYIDLMAPGEVVYSTFKGWYTYSSGSSYASPFVAGIAALARSAFPYLSAAQIGELVRVTSDDIYHISSNVPFYEMLGKGRVNAFRALSEESTAKSIRMDEYSYFSKHGDKIAFSGDTVSLTADFINYLQPVSVNSRVELSVSSPHIHMIDSVFQLGAMNSMQQKNNVSSPFRFVIAPDAPSELTLKFRFGFSDTGYDDYQYFEIRINTPFLSLPINTINYTIAANSRTGYYDAYNQLGNGITFNGSQMLAEGGLIVASSDTTVSDNILITTSWLKDNDFKLVDIPRIQTQTPFLKEAVTSFADTVNTSNPTVGVHVRHKVKGQTNSPHHQYITLEYEITNTSSSNIDSLNVGLYYDWNIGSNYQKNYADWNSSREFGYVYSSGSSGYAAIKVLNSVKNYYALDFLSGGTVDITNGFTEGEKYRTVSSGVGRRRAGFSSGGTDVAHVVGTTLYNVNVGETRKVSFMVMFGNTLSDLVSTHDNAVGATAPSVSPQPTVNGLLCKSSSYTISPQGGTNFRLYDPTNPQTPLQQGSTFTLTPNDVGKTFYVTCIDSVVESTHTAFTLQTRIATADFDAPTQIDLDENNVVSFTDKSIKPVSWQWSFGNGQTSNLKNPSVAYTAQGKYWVTLAITDSAGCVATATKSVQVVRKSPKPVIQSRFLTQCDTDSLTIPVRGGTLFAAYDTRNRLLTKGDTIRIAPYQADSIYIKNIDSAKASDPVLVRVLWASIQADFQASPKYDTLLYDNVLFQNLSSGNFNIQTTEWDFGDGSPKKQGKNVWHRYAAQGRYLVRMYTQDIRGCRRSVEKWFEVGKLTPEPIIPSVIKVCKGENITISPQGGTNFNFYLDTDQNPIASGTELNISTVNQNQQIYVTGIDSMVESEPVRVRIEVSKSNANFDFPRELNLDEENLVRFTDLSTNAVEWYWDFGNGKNSTRQHPLAKFEAQGSYRVTLITKSNLGCSDTTSRTLEAFRRSPIPEIDDIWLCQNDSTTLVPEGGSLFNFYDSPTESTPVHTGRVYNTGFISSPKTFWVTNLDSAVESPAKKIEVRFSSPKVRFEMSTDTLNTFLTDTLFVSDKSERATWWQWNFGNGMLSQNPSAFAKYSEVGNYEISLLVRDSLGCIDTLTQQLVVIDKPVITSDGGGSDGIKSRFMTYPNPTSDFLNVYVELEKEDNIQVKVFNNLGQEVLRSQKSFLRTREISFDLRQLNQGLYHVQLITSDGIASKKITLIN